jgi:hypothetical protein
MAVHPLRRGEPIIAGDCHKIQHQDFLQDAKAFVHVGRTGPKVRSGSLSTFRVSAAHFRSSPESRRSLALQYPSQRATNGLMHCNKQATSFDHLVGANQQ